MSSTQQDVVVVGGGVIGLGCAWRLAQRGLTVTVVDPDPGMGSSRAAGGMLAPISEATDFSEPLLRLGLASALRYPEFIADLEEASGLTTDYRRFGTLIMARFDDDVALLDDLSSFAEGLDLDVERLAADRCRELEPRLHPDVVQGLHVPGDHAVDNRRFYAALLAACEKAGVTLVRRWVSRLDVVAGAVRGVDVEGGEPVDGAEQAPDHLQAATVVLANGSAAASLPGLPEHARPPVFPVKGEILRLQVPVAMRPFLNRCVRGSVHNTDIYLIPRSHGELAIGATAEESADRTTTAAGVHQLLHAAMEMVPDIARLPFGEAFAASRPGSPDNGPMIGDCGVDGLVMATGHHRNGVLLTPITADAVAAVVTGEEVPAEVGAFLPGRFASA